MREPVRNDMGLSDAIEREFSLRSFKCFARQHPVLAGFSGAAVATVGAGYVLYRGAQRSLPARVWRLARVFVTF